MRFLLLLVILTACDRPITSSGKSQYVVNCAACHNLNPNLNGNIGPKLVDTPEAVFLSKVKKGIYPNWYVPKRDTKVMPVFNDVDAEAVYNYVQSFRR